MKISARPNVITLTFLIVILSEVLASTVLSAFDKCVQPTGLYSINCTLISAPPRLTDLKIELGFVDAASPHSFHALAECRDGEQQVTALSDGATFAQFDYTQSVCGLPAVKDSDAAWPSERLAVTFKLPWMNRSPQELAYLNRLVCAARYTTADGVQKQAIGSSGSLDVDLCGKPKINIKPDGNIYRWTSGEAYFACCDCMSISSYRVLSVQWNNLEAIGKVLERDQHSIISDIGRKMANTTCVDHSIVVVTNEEGHGGETTLHCRAQLQVIGRLEMEYLNSTALNISVEGRTHINITKLPGDESDDFYTLECTVADTPFVEIMTLQWFLDGRAVRKSTGEQLTKLHINGTLFFADRWRVSQPESVDSVIYCERYYSFLPVSPAKSRAIYVVTGNFVPESASGTMSRAVMLAGAATAALVVLAVIIVALVCHFKRPRRGFGRKFPTQGRTPTASSSSSRQSQSHLPDSRSKAHR